jgi:hypothetical protein
VLPVVSTLVFHHSYQTTLLAITVPVLTWQLDFPLVMILASKRSFIIGKSQQLASKIHQIQ